MNKFVVMNLCSMSIEAVLYSADDNLNCVEPFVTSAKARAEELSEKSEGKQSVDEIQSILLRPLYVLVNIGNERFKTFPLELWQKDLSLDV